jgi:hypothetical protein
MICERKGERRASARQFYGQAQHAIYCDCEGQSVIDSGTDVLIHAARLCAFKNVGSSIKSQFNKLYLYVRLIK